MLHIDEYALELFTLGFPRSPAEVKEIEDHLHVCAGCRFLHEVISAFYLALNEQRLHPEESKKAPTRLIPLNLPREPDICGRR